MSRAGNASAVGVDPRTLAVTIGRWGPLSAALSGRGAPGFALGTSRAVLVYHEAVRYSLRYRLSSHVLRLGLAPTRMRDAVGSDRLVERRVPAFHLSFLPAGADRLVEIIEPGPALILNVTAEAAQDIAEAACGRLPDRPVDLAFDGRMAPLTTALWKRGRVEQPDDVAAADRIAAELLTMLLARQPEAGARVVPLSLGRLQRIEALVDEAGAGAVDVAAMTRAAGMSRSAFMRSFALRTGLPPHQWLLRRRLEEACDRLGRGNEPIAAVALACGFASQAHLTEAMSRRFACSPQRYRRLGGAGGETGWLAT